MRDHGTEARERAHHMLSRGGYSGGECGKAAGGEIAKVAKRIVTKAVHEHDKQEHPGKHTRLRLKAGGEVHGKKAEHRPDRRARGGVVKPFDDDEASEGREMAKASGERAEPAVLTGGSYGYPTKGDPDRQPKARGGHVEERARGGKHEGKGGKGHIGAVNIAIGNPEKEQQAKQQGVQAGMQMGMQKGAQAVAQKLQGAGGPPPGAGGPPRPPMAGPPGGPPPGAPPGAMPPGAGGPPPGAPPGMMPRKHGGKIERRAMGGQFGQAPAGPPPGAMPPPSAPVGTPGGGMPPGAGGPGVGAPPPVMPPPAMPAGPMPGGAPYRRGGTVHVKEHDRRRSGGGV
jgi:hypothetical protein